MLHRVTTALATKLVINGIVRRENGVVNLMSVLTMLNVQQALHNTMVVVMAISAMVLVVALDLEVLSASQSKATLNGTKLVPQ